MGQGQDPYDGGGFTPYRPDATPDEEPPVEAPAAPPPPPGGAEVPYVPYGGGSAVPYGGSPVVSQFYVTTTTTKVGFRWLPWLIGIGVLVASCGGGIAGIVGSITGSDSVEASDSGGGVLANDLAEGQCLNGAGLHPSSSDPVSGLEVVDCSTAHDAEVLAVNVLDADEAAAYDFDDDSQVDANCRRFFSETDKEVLRAGDYFIWALTETQEPVTGDKVACLVVNADGAPLHGPVDMASPEQPVPTS